VKETTAADGTVRERILGGRGEKRGENRDNWEKREKGENGK
jgi:hypothetical protein